MLSWPSEGVLEPSPRCRTPPGPRRCSLDDRPRGAHGRPAISCITCAPHDERSRVRAGSGLLLYRAVLQRSLVSDDGYERDLRQPAGGCRYRSTQEPSLGILARDHQLPGHLGRHDFHAARWHRRRIAFRGRALLPPPRALRRDSNSSRRAASSVPGKQVAPWPVTACSDRWDMSARPVTTAAMESFFSVPQKNALNQRSWATHGGPRIILDGSSKRNRDGAGKQAGSRRMKCCARRRDLQNLRARRGAVVLENGVPGFSSMVSGKPRDHVLDVCREGGPGTDRRCSSVGDTLAPLTNGALCRTRAWTASCADLHNQSSSATERPQEWPPPPHQSS